MSNASEGVRRLERRIDQGRGASAADLVLKGGRFLDLVTGDLVASDVAICGDVIVGTFGEYRGVREIDVRGQVIVPGFIDTHLHVESSLLSPHEFERCVLPHGVTTAICDPHEMANVLGVDAFGYFTAAYGLQFIAPQGVSTDSEASPRDVARIIRQIRRDRIPAVFLENIADPRLMQQIARESGAVVGGRVYSDALSLPDGPAATYLAMMRNNVAAFGAALGQR